MGYNLKSRQVEKASVSVDRFFRVAQNELTNNLKIITRHGFLPLQHVNGLLS